MGQRGFTLLELLVALALFGVLSLLTYTSLRGMIDARQQVAGQSQSLAELQIALARLGQDLQQARDRSIRDQYGQRRPALLYSALPAAGLEFTRAGRRAYGNRPGAPLQRVRYRLEDRELLRETWPVLDRGPGSQPFGQPILSGVEEFELRFLDQQGQWRNHWPPQPLNQRAGQRAGQGAEPGAGDEELLPRAVEVWLELEKWGRIRRLFPLAVGAAAINGPSPMEDEGER